MIKKIDKPNVPITFLCRYETDMIYDVLVHQTDGFSFQLKPKKLDRPIQKQFEATLFEAYLEKPEVFGYFQHEKVIGYIEGSIQTWNLVYRVTNFWVDETKRRQKIGSKLLKHLIMHAKELGLRAVVLETQSCNSPAIELYLRCGFTFIGLDTLCYTNEDIKRGEVRLEMGLKL